MKTLSPSNDTDAMAGLCDMLNVRLETLENLLYLVAHSANDPRSIQRYAHQASCELEEVHCLVLDHCRTARGHAKRVS
jgi:hypothetical protein